MGTDNFHSKRREKRKINNRVKQKAILIATEDTKSSRYYLEALIKDKQLSGHVIFAKHIGTNPKKVLEAVLEYKSDIKYTKKWIVIDRDNFPINDYKGTIEEARQKNICVAFSNESYELWILLHFEPISSFVSRAELVDRLNKRFKSKFNKDYSKATRDIYSYIIGQQQTAITNAKNLISQQLKNNDKIDIEGNPITMIYQLIECLNNISIKTNSCDCYPINLTPIV